MIKEKNERKQGGQKFRGMMVAVVLTAALVLTMGSAAVFADAGNGFQILKTTPKDGYSRVQAQNVMVKIYFNDDVDEVVSANENNVTFTDNKGKDVKFKIYTDQKQKKMIGVLATNDLKVDKTYHVTISENFVNNDGDTLGTAQTVTFMTKTSGGGLIYALLMVAMVVVMIFFTIREQRKKKEDEEVTEGKPAQSKQRNPYKLAKEKGISVEEATRIINKEKEKEQRKIDKKLQKQKRREEKIEKQLEEEFEEYQIFHVHTKRVVKRHSNKKK